jgi:hypothetical protein
VTVSSKTAAVRRLARIVPGCLGNRSAGVAVMFAMSIFPVIAIIGAAIDLGFVTQSKAQLSAAADVAALAAVKTAANAFTSGVPNYIALGNSAGSQWFNSQSGLLMNTTLQSSSVAVTQSASVLLSTVTYQASVPTFFAKLFGITAVPLSGTASATITTQAYISVTFLLDNSSSMLIASTQAGVNLMNSLTPVTGSTPHKPSGLTQTSVPDGLGTLQCAFACHWDASSRDYYGLARNNHVELRFDVVQSAVASAINEMIIEELIPSQFSVGIYTFGSTLVHVYPASQGQPTSTDLTSGKDAAQAIQTPVGPDVANTYFPDVMTALAAASSAAGDGSVPATPKKALIIVTDGLADYGSRTTPTSKGPINPVNCNAMKNLGYSVYVLYTTYITTPANLVLPFDNIDLMPYIDGTKSPGMATSLQACASAPQDYVEASDPAAIATAMTQLLKAALGNSGRFVD